MKSKSLIIKALTTAMLLISISSISQNLRSESTKIEVVDTLTKKSQLLQSGMRNNIETKTNSDSIFFKKNGAINAKVIEIGSRDVTFKLVTPPDGPIYSMPRKTIKFIKYSDGSQDYLKVPRIKAVEDTTIRRFIFGVGLNVGYLFEDGFSKFAKDYARDYYGVAWNDNQAAGITNLGGRVSLGLRLTRTFDINACGEYSYMMIFVPYTMNKGTNFFFDRTSYGLIANKQIPIKRKLDFNISGGLMYHNLVLRDDDNKLYDGNGVGGQFQGGVNFSPVKLLTLQALIGVQFASSSASLLSNAPETKFMPKKLDMNYSGVLFTFNVFFNK